jgi:hypothetical protein
MGNARQQYQQHLLQRKQHQLLLPACQPLPCQLLWLTRVQECREQQQQQQQQNR